MTTLALTSALSHRRARINTLPRLSRRAAFWAVAFAFLALTAFATAPSALYGLYAQREHLAPITLTVVYAIYERDGDWMIAAMPEVPGGFDQRVPLPEEWAGLRDADIQKATGVPDAVFVHAARFCGAAGSKEGALGMARRALTLAR